MTDDLKSLIIGTFRPREFDLGARDKRTLHALRARAEEKCWSRADVLLLTPKPYQRYWDAHTVQLAHHTAVNCEMLKVGSAVRRYAEVQHTDYRWRPSDAALLDIAEALGFTRDVDISDAWHDDFGGDMAFFDDTPAIGFRADGKMDRPIVDMRGMTWTGADGENHWAIEVRREGSDKWETVPSFFLAADGTMALDTIKPPSSHR